MAGQGQQVQHTQVQHADAQSEQVQPMQPASMKTAQSAPISAPMQPTSAQPSTTHPQHTLTFLGTGASCGVPSFYCGCKACEEARSNPRAARGCSGLLITGKQQTLVDTPPELRLQLIREQVSSIDQVVYTHEHFDHMGGLPQLEFFVRLQQRSPLPVYAGAHALAAIEQQYGFMTDTLDLLRIDSFGSVELDGIVFQALPAQHNKGAFGYLIDSGVTRVAYFPDTGPLPEESLAAIKGVDILIIDATFYGKNWMPQSHHTVDEAIALAVQVGARQAYLTHLTMHYDTPLTLAELTALLEPYNGAIAVAHDGLQIAF